MGMWGYGFGISPYLPNPPISLSILRSILLGRAGVDRVGGRFDDVVGDAHRAEGGV